MDSTSSTVRIEFFDSSLGRVNHIMAGATLDIGLRANLAHAGQLMVLLLPRDQSSRSFNQAAVRPTNTFYQEAPNLSWGPLISDFPELTINAGYSS